MDFEIKHVGPEDYEKVIWDEVEESEEFANFFYFVSTIDELQKMGFTEGIVEITQGVSSVFHAMKKDGYQLSPLDISRVINRFFDWDQEKKTKLVKFYTAYHAKFRGKK